MTRKLALLIGGALGGLVLALLTTLPVLADGGPHQRSSATSVRTSCASCHRSHTAQAPNLLKDAQPAMCLDCHGDTAQGAGTNVEGGVYWSLHDPRGGTVLPSRAGGFKFALIDTAIKPGSPGAANADGTTAKSGATSLYTNLNAISQGFIGVLSNPNRQAASSTHIIDPNVDVNMWGYGDNSPVMDGGRSYSRITCGSCHDPHGNGMYRILRPIPEEAGTLGQVALAAVNIPDTTTTAGLPNTGTKSYTTANYWNVNETAAVAANISDWCAQCHTRYLAGAGSANAPNTKNGVTDQAFKFRHTTDVSQPYQPNCLQCHVAHGTNAVETGRTSGGVFIPGASMEFPWPGQDENHVVSATDSRLLRLDNRAGCAMGHLK